MNSDDLTSPPLTRTSWSTCATTAFIGIDTPCSRRSVEATPVGSSCPSCCLLSAGSRTLQPGPTIGWSSRPSPSGDSSWRMGSGQCRWSQRSGRRDLNGWDLGNTDHCRQNDASPDAIKNPFTFHRAHYFRESSCERVALEPVLLNTALIANSYAAGALGLRQAQPERY